MEHLLVGVRRWGSSNQGNGGGQLKVKLNDGFWEIRRKRRRKLKKKSEKKPEEEEMAFWEEEWNRFLGTRSEEPQEETGGKKREGRNQRKEELGLGKILT